MTVDPRTPIVQVMARLGRETQLHLDERHRHFKITDKVIVVFSLLLIALASLNVYYVTVLYQDLNGIVDNMDSMYSSLSRVDTDMDLIARRFSRINVSIGEMSPITADMASMRDSITGMRDSMVEIETSMVVIDENMWHMSNAMRGVADNVNLMTGGVSIMRQNVHQISGPMGAINPILPN